MNIPGEVLDSSLPKNRRQRHRVVMGLSVAGTMCTVWAIVIALTSGLPLVGQVAWASDVDKKIAQATKPIEDKVGQLENAVKQQTQVSNSLLANITASQIRATYARLCNKPNDTERERLSSDLDRYLAEYPKYTDGARFPVESLRCQL